MTQQINLYEPRLRPRRELAVARNLGICAASLLVAMTALSLWVRLDADRQAEAASLSLKQLVDEQERLTALAKVVAQRQVSPALLAELDVTKAMLASSSEVMAVLESGKLGNTSGFSAFMSGFAQQSQSDLWLTGFLVTVGGEEIEIRGRLLDPARLPAYMQRLSNVPVFQGRRFAALEMRGVDPDEKKPEQPRLAGAVSAGAQQNAVAKVPHFTEFVLRSENVGATDAAAHGAMKR